MGSAARCKKRLLDFMTRSLFHCHKVMLCNRFLLSFKVIVVQSGMTVENNVT
jgi:hypothetical protein